MRIHLFPFDLIEKGTDIVIYGLGTLGKEYIAEIISLEWCNIKYVVDKNPKSDKFYSIPVLLPEEIDGNEECLFLIAVYDCQLAEAIQKDLEQLGIDEKRILWRDRICNIRECNADILEPLEIRSVGIEDIQKVFIPQGFYISGIPFYMIKTYGIDRYLSVEEKFCRTNSVDNTLDQTRLFFMIENLENIIPFIRGDIAELGVYQGATAEIFLDYCKRYDRKLFLFDTFNGFSIKDIKDIDAEQDVSLFVDTDEYTVSRRLGNEENIRIKKGYFPKSVDDEVKNNKYAFVHIDCDLYQPIYAGLSFFWPRMSTGGMMVIHDYSSGFWEGATKAVNQFCEENNISKVMIPDWSGSVVLMKN